MKSTSLKDTCNTNTNTNNTKASAFDQEMSKPVQKPQRVKDVEYHFGRLVWAAERLLGEGGQFEFLLSKSGVQLESLSEHLRKFLNKAFVLKNPKDKAEHQTLLQVLSLTKIRVSEEDKDTYLKMRVPDKAKLMCRSRYAFVFRPAMPGEQGELFVDIIFTSSNKFQRVIDYWTQLGFGEFNNIAVDKFLEHVDNQGGVECVDVTQDVFRELFEINGETNRKAIEDAGKLCDGTWGGYSKTAITLGETSFSAGTFFITRSDWTRFVHLKLPEGRKPYYLRPIIREKESEGGKPLLKVQAHRFNYAGQMFAYR
jgi:hypothetical protein